MNDSVIPQANAPAHTDPRWKAVLAKDAARDGEFVFAVSTTGIYCRPSCPARTPKRGNVRFFDSPELARRAGFRACKRCHPDDASAREKQVRAILRACALIEQSEERVTLDELAAKVGLSPYYFHRLFKDVTGVTPRDFHRARQISRVGAALATAGSVTDALYDAGFSSSGRFYENTNAMLGMKPAAWRAGGAGEEIRYCVHPCALGLVLVAATERGVCTIEFGDSADELTTRLQERFPKARFAPADAEFDAWLRRLLAHLDRPSAALDLPLDVRGTAFQQQVWKALRDLKPGETASYAEVAARIGKPKSVRAVARACASNILGVAIPCHRVVRSDGGISGYRWGVERKRALLAKERKR
jgi:AraC family transcriptional regulator of adaptative response/methylated-DNA-[protein]-cysteine methyltransferase